MIYYSKIHAEVLLAAFEVYSYTSLSWLTVNDWRALFKYWNYDRFAMRDEILTAMARAAFYQSEDWKRDKIARILAYSNRNQPQSKRRRNKQAV